MLKLPKNEELRWLTLLLNFSAMIANNKGADQTARKTSAFIVLRDFSHRGPCDVEAQSSLLLPCCAPLS